jgi:hypothetical protein
MIGQLPDRLLSLIPDIACLPSKRNTTSSNKLQCTTERAYKVLLNLKAVPSSAEITPGLHLSSRELLLGLLTLSGKLHEVGQGGNSTFREI